MKRPHILTVSEPGRDGVFFCVRDWMHYLWAKRPGLALDLAYSSKRGSSDLDDFIRECDSMLGERVDLKIAGAPGFSDLKALCKIYGLIRRHHPKLIHAHSSKAGGLVRLLGILPGMPPILYTSHAYFGMGEQGGIKEWFYNALERVLSPMAVTVCTSDDEASFAERKLGIPKKRLRVCHHGLPAEVFKTASPETKRQAREELGLPPEGKFLLTVGRISTQKNYEPLYEMLPSLCQKSSFELIHVGLHSTRIRETLPQSCRERVHAWEHFSKAKMKLLYYAADGFLMTSLYEGFSLAVLEALAEGLPLILTDAPGFRVYRKLDFKEIRWVPLHKEEFPKGLLRAVLDWDRAGESRLQDQVERGKTYFLQSAQHAEMEAIYEEICPDLKGVS